jgi:hypothetical protein
MDQIVSGIDARHCGADGCRIENVSSDDLKSREPPGSQNLWTPRQTAHWVMRGQKALQ